MPTRAVLVDPNIADKRRKTPVALEAAEERLRRIVVDVNARYDEECGTR
jgi:hypothetical protein